MSSCTGVSCDACNDKFFTLQILIISASASGSNVDSLKYVELKQKKLFCIIIPSFISSYKISNVSSKEMQTIYFLLHMFYITP